MKSNLPRTIAQSNITLAVAIVAYLLSFALLRHDVAGGGEGGLLWQWLHESMPALTTSRWTTLAMHVAALYMLLELDAVYALIRVRTVSQLSLMLLLLAAMPTVFNVGAASSAALFVFYSLFPFFSTYQSDKHSHKMMQAGVSLGIAALLMPCTLWLALLWVMMMPGMRNFTPRHLFALSWGVAIPFMAVATYSYCTGRMDIIIGALADVAAFDTIAYSGLDTRTVAGWCLMAFVTATSVTHAIYRSYDDKIKTRFLLYHLCWLAAITVAAATVMPDEATGLMTVAMMPAAMLAGHTVTLLDTRGGRNYVFVLLAAIIAVAAINIVTR